ncbi:hypothetical protein QFC20_004328 [Naganishia adeliensis]|uniref:Uncharacterized protein n=1 Tax=Naganishia adeliensis TaxID=92952 RepID=A0ACC2W177_9TREE|nr:hypothetical protein QFC20_004328 [Naganishia adeliensis]
MNGTTPAITTRLSIRSAGDLHDATPVLANSHDRRHTSSSDGTRAAEDDMSKGEKQPQMQGGIGDAGAPRGPPFRKFGRNFFDPEIAPLRKVVFKIIIPFTTLLTIVMWTALPMYWGSFWKANTHSENLTVMILNRDSAAPTSLGSTIVNAGLANKNGSTTNGSLVGRLGFFEGDVAEYPDEASVMHAVTEEKWWAVVVVNTDATARLQTARQTGDATYIPRSAIDFYYAQGRMENAINGYLVPITSSVLTQATERWAAQSIASYLSGSSGNATVIQALASAPRTVTPGVSYTTRNLRPFSTPVATAVTLVGQIYMLIIRITFNTALSMDKLTLALSPFLLRRLLNSYFTFVFAMAFNAVREIIGPKLRLKSYLIFRLAVPIIVYAWLSLNLAMINLPFKVPFDAKYSYAGGFFLWWVVLWAGMLAVGFALEFCIVLMTPRFVAFALLPIIIVQVSVVSLPHELQPRLYRYGVATPFFRVSNAVRTIIFNTKNEIGMDVGILLAWALLSVITVTLLTTVIRRKEVKKEHAEQEKTAVGKA